MSSPRKSVYTDSSDQDEMNSEEKNLQLFSKNMLQGRIFIGTFLEKRYVDNLKTYRHVISIDQNEIDLLYDLNIINKKIRKYTTRWVGITTPEMIGAPAGHCLWIDHLENELFGPYWFKIRNIKFRSNEVMIKLKQLRPVQPVNKISLKAEGDQSLNVSNINVSQIFNDLKQSFLDNMYHFSTQVATLKNMKDAIVFLSVLVMALFMSIVQLVQYLGEFLLRLMRELSFFLRSATPVLIACVNMIGRSIAGLYTLIVMLWRDGNKPKMVYVNEEPRFQAIMYDKQLYAQRRALPPPAYFRRQSSGVKITPLD